jgi:NADP-dependent aldehyde dehydrogenase
MKLTGQNLIGKEFSSKGTRTFNGRDPVALQALQPSFTEATPEEVDQAVSKAEAAFSEYKAKTPEQRAAFLEAIGDEIMALGEELISRCMSETALSEGRLLGERTRTINQLKLFAQVVRDGSWIGARIDTAIPGRQPLPKPDIRQMQVPLGPVGIFGASNFPLAFSVAGGDTASALAAGCPVVVKGHPLHPGTSEMVGAAIIMAAEKTGMPDGVFSLIQGTSVEVGMAIVMHPLIVAIGFTGSFRGGKAIFDAANSRPVPIPVFAEMGSTNPVFVLPGALKERKENIASGLAGSVTLGVGQFCTNPGLVVSEDSEDSKFLCEAIARILDETSGEAMLSEGIKTSYESGIAKLSGVPGVTALTGNEAERHATKASPSVFVSDASSFFSNHDLQKEIFGPSTLCVMVSGKKEMMKLASQLEGHLTATIHGTVDDLEKYTDLIGILERKVGRIIYDGYPTGVEVCHSMVHGGPYPATTASQTTSVGTAAIFRFSRPVCYQGFPQSALPDGLKDSNPMGLWRLVDGEYTNASC